MLFHLKQVDNKGNMKYFKISSPNSVLDLMTVKCRSNNQEASAPFYYATFSPFLSGLRFLSTGGGSQSATGTGLLGGVFGLDLKPI